jgi:hypothetical protein
LDFFPDFAQSSAAVFFPIRAHPRRSAVEFFFLLQISVITVNQW